MVTVEILVDLSELFNPLRAVDWGGVAAALGIDFEVSSAPAAQVWSVGEDSVHSVHSVHSVWPRGELHHDVVAGGLVLCAALAAGGEPTAVTQTCNIDFALLFTVCVFWLQTTDFWLLTPAYWLLITDNCLLTTAYCLLPTDYWILTTDYSPWTCLLSTTRQSTGASMNWRVERAGSTTIRLRNSMDVNPEECY